MQAASEIEHSLTIREVEAVTRRTRATIYRWMNRGVFPHPIQPVPNGPNIWPETSIREWLERQKDAARSKDVARAAA